MSKRQEIRARRQRKQVRNRVLTILLIAFAAIFMAFVLIIPGLQQTRKTAQLATDAAKTPVIAITPRSLSIAQDGTNLGDPNAPVKVEAWEDFRCSACLYFTQNIEPQIIQNYVATGKVYYSFHNFIVIDSNDGTDASLRSANAAMCANAQNKFWEYHDTLFANQITESAGLFTDARLTRMAENLGLDMTSFNQCYQARQFKDAIQNDVSRGISLGIQGTPSIFVNGTLVGSPDAVIQKIDSALNGQ
jgi:protein-disulfide isomerase